MNRTDGPLGSRSAVKDAVDRSDSGGRASARTRGDVWRTEPRPPGEPDRFRRTEPPRADRPARSGTQTRRPGPGRPPGSRNHAPAPRYDVGKTARRDLTVTAANNARVADQAIRAGPGRTSDCRLDGVGDPPRHRQRPGSASLRSDMQIVRRGCPDPPISFDDAAGSGLRGALAATRLGHLEGVRRLAGRGRGGAPGPGAVR
jgi:hypothetical protein